MSEKREIPNCWRDLSDQEVADNLQYLAEHCREYDIKFYSAEHLKIGNVSIEFMIFDRDEGRVYSVNSRKISQNYKNGVICSKLVWLISNCEQEFLKRHNKLVEQYADVKEQIEKMKKRETWLIAISVTLMMVLVSMGIYGARKQNANKNIEKHVNQHEKTLPEYLEQKQVVANYRDSLQNAKMK
jgi:hypothetical protein